MSFVHTFSIAGVDSVATNSLCNIVAGLPSFDIVGLADGSTREVRVRVRSALLTSGLQWPTGRIAVDVHPAHTRKHGTHYDLPIAVAVLASSSQVPEDRIASTMFVGELALDGSVRPVRGPILAAEAAARAGFSTLIVAPENGAEALAAGVGVAVRVARHMRDVVAWLRGEDSLPLAAARSALDVGTLPDMSEFRGDPVARRALEIAAAGAHHLLLVGSPGAGLTSLARRLPTILPDLDNKTSLELTRIHSVCGLNIAGGRVDRIPFRAPHHSTVGAGLTGGGVVTRPGEVSLAHGGVLFLDEVTEFAHQALAMLREPLADGEVQLSRAAGVVKLPARAHLVVGMRPCPCGQRGHAVNCRCAPAAIQRHEQRADALDALVEMRCDVATFTYGELAAAPTPESSATIKARVVAARTLMASTSGYDEDDDARRVIVCALERTGLSRSGLDKARAVACTVAALDGSVIAGRIGVRGEHLLEALRFTPCRETRIEAPTATA